MKKAKVSKEYKKIIDSLNDLKDHCKSMVSDDSEPIWQQDVWALQEAMDIISDYEKAVAETSRLIQQYEMPDKAQRKAAGIYTCPNCGKRIQSNCAHCHCCGKKISWGR